MLLSVALRQDTFRKQAKLVDKLTAYSLADLLWEKNTTGWLHSLIYYKKKNTIDWHKKYSLANSMKVQKCTTQAKRTARNKGSFAQNRTEQHHPLLLYHSSKHRFMRPTPLLHIQVRQERSWA